MNSATSYFLGMIDEVRAYNRAITDQEASVLNSFYMSTNDKVRQTDSGIVYTSGQFLENL